MNVQLQQFGLMFYAMTDLHSYNTIGVLWVTNSLFDQFQLRVCVLTLLRNDERFIHGLCAEQS